MPLNISPLDITHVTSKGNGTEHQLLHRTVLSLYNPELSFLLSCRSVLLLRTFSLITSDTTPCYFRSTCTSTPFSETLGNIIDDKYKALGTPQSSIAAFIFSCTQKISVLFFPFVRLSAAVILVGTNLLFYPYSVP